MSAQQVRARDKDPLAQFLGWFSVALGTAQVSAPRLMCRLVGASDEGRSPMLMRLMGLRELGQGIGILTRARPTVWLWSRVRVTRSISRCSGSLPRRIRSAVHARRSRS